MSSSNQQFAALMNEVKELRLIKNKLAIIKQVAESNKFNLDREMSNWLSIQEALP